MTDKYAVFGNPIQQSKSPQIHQLFAEQFDLDISYRKQQPDEDGFAEAAEKFFAEGGRGMNITTPFKDDAYQFANQLTPRARRAGAVNTLKAVGEERGGELVGEVLGDTTDGVGMVRDIRDNLGWKISGKRILILGAGGAVRGVLADLLEENPESLTIANRTAAKAVSLAKGFQDLGAINGIGLAELEGEQFDMIINGTSISVAGGSLDLPTSIFASEGVAYDMGYAADLTPFLAWAHSHASSYSDGRGMLVEQAAESFFIWTGYRPDTETVKLELNQMVAS